MVATYVPGPHGPMVFSSTAGAATKAIDGSNSANATSGSSLAVTLTTTQANDVVFAMVLLNSVTVGSITDNSGVTTPWQLVTQSNVGGQDIEIWWAVASTALSGATITVNASPTAFVTVHVFGVSGVSNTASPFDGAGVNGASDPISITTTNANDMIIGGFRMASTASPTAGSGYTTIQGNNFLLSEFKAVSSASTYSVTIGTGAGNANGSVAVAVK